MARAQDEQALEHMKGMVFNFFFFLMKEMGKHSKQRTQIYLDSGKIIVVTLNQTVEYFNKIQKRNDVIMDKCEKIEGNGTIHEIVL